MDLNNSTNRRDFLKKTGKLAAVGIFSGTMVNILCSCEKDELLPVIPSQTLTVNLTQYPQLLNIGGTESLSLTGMGGTKVPVLIKRIDATTFGVFNGYCPHQGEPIIIPGPGADYYCPRHGATFDTSTGTLKLDPPNMKKNLVKYTYTFNSTSNNLSINVTNG